MIEQLIQRMRRLDLLNVRDDELDAWATDADDALQEAADVLEALHNAVLVMANTAQEALQGRRN